MPRYDYKCTACSQEFELIQSFKEAGSGVCTVCGGAGQRVYHAVPVIYKGSGFYTTDYGRPKPPAENGAKEDKSNSSDDSSGKAKEKVGAAESSSSNSGSDSAASSKTSSDSSE